MDDSLPSSPRVRSARLAALQATKMAASASAFVRGTPALFYRALPGCPPLPEGPALWAAGDCHVENVGAVLGPGGAVDIELNDFDEAVRGPPAWDVVRLALSAAMEARQAGLSGGGTCALVRALAAGYREVLVRRARGGPLEVGAPPRRFARLLERAHRKTTDEALRKRFDLGEDALHLPLGESYWPVTRGEREAVERLLGSAGVRALLERLSGHGASAPVEVLDVAFRVAGTGSLGAWRVAALVRLEPGVTGEEGKARRALRLLDVKEVRSPAAPWRDEAPPPADPVERVLAGARALCPPMGERMMAAEVAGRRVLVRELVPEEKKARLAGLEAEEVEEVSHFLGAVLGRAHARQLGAREARAWERAFAHAPAGIPRWLWDTLVDLVAFHERAYLEHCRAQAQGAAGDR